VFFGGIGRIGDEDGPMPVLKKTALGGFFSEIF
jgi:hypothetical protein